MRPGVTVPPITKVKSKDNKIGVKTKKVPKSDGKTQPPIKTKPIAAKGKIVKNVVKEKTVKKK